MMGKEPARNRLLRKQPLMRHVLIALIPCLAGSVYFFGWRCLAVVAVSCLAAFLAEYSFCRRRNEPVSTVAPAELATLWEGARADRF